jgi:membrane protein
VRVQPDRHERQPSVQPETPRLRPARYKALAAARDRFEGSLAQSFLARLKALDFADQAMLFGGGLLVSLLPFVILLSAFASQRVDDDISLRLGLDRRAAGIVDHLLTSSPATLNAATATSLIVLIAGMLAVARSLQQIDEKVFRQDHWGIWGLGRLLTWIVVLCAAMVAERLAERPVSSAAAGAGPAGHRRHHDAVLLVDDAPPARGPGPVAYAAAVGDHYRGPLRSLGVSSKFYFSGTIISDSRTYGTIGAIFGLMTWFIAIGAVIILGAVAGAVWKDRRN